MSKSWRQPPPEGRLPTKPKYERTLEEEMAEMDEERYLVIAAWGPKGTDVELEEVVSLNRTERGAWQVLSGIAEGQGVELHHADNSFTTDGDEHTEYYVWYITGIMEGP